MIQYMIQSCVQMQPQYYYISAIKMNRVKNEVLRAVKGERSILHTTKRKNTNWIGHNLRTNCLLKHFIEGKI
jgi:hypothetical protein